MKITPKDAIFATGVFLKPVEVELHGKKQWRWIAISFEDDSYFDGNTIDVYDYADSFEGLFQHKE